MNARFEFVPPPLPQLTVRCPAIFDLAETMRTIYPSAGKLGSMIRLSADHFFDLHTDERTVVQWMFARFCDLPSIDAALPPGLVDVPRPQGRPVATTAASMADFDAQTISSDPRHAASLAAGLYWHTLDRVNVISTRGAAAIILDVPGSVQ